MALGNGTELTWYGHATWLLVTPDGKRILIDPWKTGNPAWPAGLDDPGDIDALLITHAHGDHMADAVPMAAAGKPDGVVCMIEIGDYLEKKGVENVIGMNKGGSVDVAGCRVTMVHASHSSSFEDGDGYVYLGDPVGFIVRTGDLSLYIAGDTCVFGDMALIARLYKPNVALLPIGGFFTMDPYEAAEAVPPAPGEEGRAVPLRDVPAGRRHARSAAPRGPRRGRPRGARRAAGRDRPVTFSLVACDLEAATGVSPWPPSSPRSARSCPGCGATSARWQRSRWRTVLYGPDGLTLLREGAGAEDAAARPTGPDGQRDERQLGIVDGSGGSRPSPARSACHGRAAAPAPATPRRATS